MGTPPLKILAPHPLIFQSLSLILDLGIVFENFKLDTHDLHLLAYDEWGKGCALRDLGGPVVGRAFPTTRS